MNTVETVLDSWVAKQMGDGFQGSPETILNDQNRMCNQILDFAITKSVFYRDWIKKNHNDWQSIPFTVADDLKMRGREMLCCSQDDIKRVVTLETSGTTGPPKRLYFTEKDQKRTIEYFRVGMDTFTRDQDKVLILLPCEREGSIGRLLGEALKLSGKTPILQGVVKHLSETFQRIEELKPDVIVGIPFQVLGLVKYGIFINKEIAVRNVLLSTDWVSEVTVGLITQYWNSEVFRYYGMTETGFGGGIECSRHQGYHMYESDFYIEIIDPITGECLPDGEMGEVVITTLKREGMPLIRYRTGDQSRIIPETCSCGSVLKRLEDIKTRISGKIKLCESDYFTKGEVDEVLLDIKTLMDYKIQIKRNNEHSTLCIQIFYLESSVDDRLIIERLKNIESIKIALEKHTLRVSVDSIIVDTDYCPHPAKRKIEE